MRVALYGGTFDPPHLGHVAVARAAADRFALDQVLFAPAGVQPLKRDSAVASYAERLQMCSLLSAEDARFRVSEVDAPYGDGRPNYTADALARLETLRPEDRVFALVGADSFMQIGHWHEPERLLQLAEWIVVSRPGVELDEPAGLRLDTVDRGRINLLETVHVEVSATDLRVRLAAGEDCQSMLPAGVADFIAQHGLYRRARG